MRREIPLSRGLVAIVDDDDFEWLSRWKWHARASDGRYYAARSASKAELEAGSRRTIYMHRVVCNPAPGLLADHANRDTLDNRRSNLRAATPSQNTANAHRRRSAVGFLGVAQKSPLRWRATIGVGRSKLLLGYYRTPEAAARAYDAAAKERYGEFAALNFPDAARAA